MPGRNYASAFARFEESLGETFLSQPYPLNRWSIYSPTSPSANYNNHEDSKSSKRLSDPPDSAIATGYTPQVSSRPRTPPIYRNANAAMPPTPPSKTHYSSSSYPSQTISTPVDYHRPPTPDSTPSRSLDDRTPDVSFAMPSSYADSYRTALDYQQSTEGDTDASHYFSTHTLRMPTPVAQHRPSSAELHLESPIQHIHTQERREIAYQPLLHKPTVPLLSESSLHGQGKARAATPRLYIPVPLEFKPLELDFMSSEQPTRNSTPEIPQLMRGLSLRSYKKPYPAQRESVSSYTPTSANSAWKMFSPSRDDASNRSSVSTVVRAIITDHTPTTPVRKLRRSAKTHDLRDEASQADPLSPRYRDSLAALHSPRERKASQDSPLYAQKRWGSIDSNTLDASPELLRPMPKSYFDTKSAIYMDAPPSTTQGLSTHHHQDVNEQVDGQNDEQIVSTRPRAKHYNTMESYTMESPTSITNEHSAYSPSTNEHSRTRLYDYRRPSDERSAQLSSGMVQLRPYQVRRGSMESSHPALTTALSFPSDSGVEALSVNEATAVNIFPHHNQSLVVVEHPRIPNWTSADNEALSTPLSEQPQSYLAKPRQYEQPVIKLDTSGFGEQFAPDLPILAVIPPTPATEVESHAGSPLRQRPLTPPFMNPPSRRRSLMDRAREISDNVLQPLLGLSKPNDDQMNRTSIDDKRSRPNTKERMAGNHPDINLHPFWQPRAFWDDLSDVTTTDENASDRGHNRLPPGGDTSDLVYPTILQDHLQGQLPGRFDSIKGFLVGNSLGLERGPTNKRRHVVRWPTGKMRRRTATEPRTSSDDLVPVPSSRPSTNATSSTGNRDIRPEPRRIASVRDSARHSAGAAHRERRKTKYRVRLSRRKWLLNGWIERLMARRLRL